MKINSFSSYSVSFFKESFLPPLSSQHQKILKIVSIAFALLATCYLINRLWNHKLSNDKKDLEVGKEKKNIPAKIPEEDKDIKMSEQKLKMKFILPDGSQVEEGYFEEFDFNKINGQGKLIFEGDFIIVAEGLFEKGNLSNGKITNQGSNIREFEGSFNFDHLFKRRKVKPDGDLEEGQFNLLREGLLLEGKGRIILDDGKIEEGEFKNGWLNGNGKKTNPTTGIIEEGIFESGFLIQPKK